jgi:hypothetical protein
VQLVAVLVAEERAPLVGRQVDLAHQDRVATAAADEPAQVAQEVMGLGERAPRQADRLDQEGHRVHTEAGQALNSQYPTTCAISSRTAGWAIGRARRETRDADRTCG